MRCVRMKQFINMSAAIGILCVTALVIVVGFLWFPVFVTLIEWIFPHASSAPRPEQTIGSYQYITDANYLFPFQDGMRYTEYGYTQVSFENNPYFQQVTQEKKEEILAFIENFEWWVDEFENSTEDARVQFHAAYGYDRANLSESDFYYIDTDSCEYPFHDYRVYIFDAEQMTLYYMGMH